MRPGQWLIIKGGEPDDPLPTTRSDDDDEDSTV